MTSPAATTDRTAFRLAFVFPWCSLAVTALAVVVFGAPARESQLLAFAASIVVFGLPHGAVDHLTPSWTTGEPVTRRGLAAVGALYLVVGLAYASVWFVAPIVAFGLFILLTWLHWGLGELHPLMRLVGPTHLRTRTAKLLTVAVRGSLPMALPLVAFPGEYRWVARQLVGLFGAGELDLLDPLFAPTGRVAVAGIVGAFVVSSLVVGYPGSPRRSWTIDAGETLFLTAYFLVVPPILAVGVFFCCWHSVRHIVRLGLLDDTTASRLGAGDVRGALGRFMWQATPMSLGALVSFGVLALAVPVAPVGWAALFAVYLVGIALVTAPHVIIVSWMDFETEIW